MRYTTVDQFIHHHHLNQQKLIKPQPQFWEIDDYIKASTRACNHPVVFSTSEVPEFLGHGFAGLWALLISCVNPDMCMGVYMSVCVRTCS